MAKKSFLNKAKQTFSEGGIIVEERASNKRRGEIEGTSLVFSKYFKKNELNKQGVC